MHRRNVLGLLTMLAVAGLLQPSGLLASDAWTRHPAIVELLAGRVPEHDGIVLELPSVSEDGSNVPMRVAVDSPMTAEAFVTAVHVFAPANPAPPVLTARFQPEAGMVDLSTRIRLNESQRVFAVAELSDGSVRLAEQTVRVTVSGCLTTAGGSNDAIMQTRVRMPGSAAPGEPVELLSLIQHPMETGFRRNAGGELQPRHLLDRLQVALAGQPLVELLFQPSVSANPYVRLLLRPAASGPVELTWNDDQGRVAREQLDFRLR